MALDELALDQLFRKARTHSAWLDRPVTDDTLRELYDLVKWAPTSANTNPTRFLFLRTKRAKERLLPALAPGNVEKVMTAPVTVIVAYDLMFFEKLPQLFPHAPAMRENFAKNPQLVEVTARRNSSLQGAYLILAARALGLDCGPALRLRQRQAGSRVLRRRPRVRRVRSGVPPRRPRPFQFSDQPRATATRPNSARATRGWRSKRRARCCRRRFRFCVRCVELGVFRLCRVSPARRRDACTFSRETPAAPRLYDVAQVVGWSA